ncbi:MAG: hypothetical protein LRY73_02415 [Bacillus sp. (in: Bacteria)]|nr:hypothetical protein [Bacillus sp. (in: firmicutes)]
MFYQIEVKITCGIRIKKYYLSQGLLLAFLSFILVLLYETDPTHTPPSSTLNELPSGEGEASGNISGDINITDTGNEDIPVGSEQVDEEELRAFAREAIEGVNLTSSLSEPNERSFFEHARLNHYYLNLMGNRFSEDEEMEEEAEWVAKELVAWLQTAGDMSAFHYSESDFISFVEKNDYLVEDDISTLILLEELEKYDEVLFLRHLEYQYIKLYIWESIQEDLRDTFSKESNETEEEYLFRLYGEFETIVTDYLISQNPELVND